MSVECETTGVACGVYTFFKTQGVSGVRDTLFDFIEACFTDDRMSSSFGPAVVVESDDITLDLQSSDPSVLEVVDYADRVELVRRGRAPATLDVTARRGGEHFATLAYYFDRVTVTTPALPLAGVGVLFGLIVIVARRALR